ncbi:MAG: peptide chain release factor N(5)-glutamine methyltransferase [Planctomycetaceae bacterium]|nr:peptide chain release factor N(5)-glutamine methyltransferase [Planctomycetaceae bacterium]
MPPEEKWTVSRLLAWTRDFFKKKGIEKPQLEAEILLACAMQIKRIELYTIYESEPPENQRAVYRDFVRRRGAGEPVAYLVGSKEFYSLTFKVDRRVLIPRPETEDLVLQTLDKLSAYPAGSEPVIADVGTGSGILAVTLAKHLPKHLTSAKIIAVDISPEALAVAEHNAAVHHVAEKIEFRQSDLLEQVAEPPDIVVSNPPYVSRPEYEALPDDVKNFEPKLALLAGENGTEIAERLIAQSSVKLKPGGYLLIEGSPMIAEKVKSFFTGCWDDSQILPDLAGRQRIICGRKRQ